MQRVQNTESPEDAPGPSGESWVCIVLVRCLRAESVCRTKVHDCRTQFWELCMSSQILSFCICQSLSLL